jgi:hypothetical protein
MADNKRIKELQQKTQRTPEEDQELRDLESQTQPTSENEQAPQKEEKTPAKLALAGVYN